MTQIIRTIRRSNLYERNFAGSILLRPESVDELKTKLEEVQEELKCQYS